MVRNGYIGEVIRALAVLALVFFNFAHAPMAAGAPADPAWTAFDSFCGDAPDGGDSGPAPCHACRIGGGADLPAPAGCTETVRTAVVLPSPRTPPPVAPGSARAWPAARGPPRLA